MTRISVRVTPRAPRNEVLGWEDDVLRVRVTAPPADGKANDALVALLARVLNTSKSSIEIVAGRSARTKIVEVKQLSLHQIRDALQPPAS